MADETKKTVGSEASAPKSRKASPPTCLRMTSLFAYYDEDGAMKQWPEGAEVTDPDEIADLLGRGAPAEEKAAD